MLKHREGPKTRAPKDAAVALPPEPLRSRSKVLLDHLVEQEGEVNDGLQAIVAPSSNTR